MIKLQQLILFAYYLFLQATQTLVLHVQAIAHSYEMYGGGLTQQIFVELEIVSIWSAMLKPAIFHGKFLTTAIPDS